MVQSGLGPRIKAARLVREWTQVELARAVKVRQGTVSDWESGLSEPKFSDLVALETVLGVSFRAEQPGDYFARGVAVGEFRALAAMANAMAERATEAANTIAGPTTPRTTPGSAPAGSRTRSADAARGARQQRRAGG